jgi:tetratricopeptide (TPR) repeat protein
MQDVFQNSFDALIGDMGDDLSLEDKEILIKNVSELIVHAYESNFPDMGVAVGLPQDYFDGLHAVAAKYASNERYEDASVLFKRLMQLKPTEAVYYKGLGACQLGLKNYQGAEVAYSSAEMLKPQDPEIHFYLGQALYFQKKFAPAFDNFRFARVLAEKYPEEAGKIAEWSTQLLERLKPLVSPEQASKIDLRPPTH